jgi:hypothetical protein
VDARTISPFLTSAHCPVGAHPSSQIFPLTPGRRRRPRRIQITGPSRPYGQFVSVIGIAAQWVGVIGALGGVVATGVIALITAVLNHGWQRTNVREERLYQERMARAALQRETYTRYLAAREALESFVVTRQPWPNLTPAERLREMRDQDSKVFDEDDAALAEVRLLSGDRVFHAVDEFDEKWMAAYAEAVHMDEPMKAGFRSTDALRTTMLAAMRAEQTALLERAAPVT